MEVSVAASSIEPFTIIIIISHYNAISTIIRLARMPMGVTELISVFPFKIKRCHFQSNPYIIVIIPISYAPDKLLFAIGKNRR